jgi:hypothetical protein
MSPTSTAASARSRQRRGRTSRRARRRTARSRGRTACERRRCSSTATCALRRTAGWTSRAYRGVPLRARTTITRVIPRGTTGTARVYQRETRTVSMRRGDVRRVRRAMAQIGTRRAVNVCHGRRIVCQPLWHSVTRMSRLLPLPTPTHSARARVIEVSQGGLR